MTQATNTQGLYSTKIIAELFELTEQRVNQLAQQKIIPKAGRGLFDLGPTVQAYIRYLRRQGGSVGEMSSWEQRLLKAQAEEREAKARIAKLQADVLDGKLLKLEDVSQQWTARYIELKAAMLEFPRRVAFRFTDPTVRVNVEEEATAFVAELLDRYSREGIMPDSSLAPGDTEKLFETPETDDGKPVGGREQDT